MTTSTLPYLLTGHNRYEYTEKAFVLITEGRLSVKLLGEGQGSTIIASGDCPYCAHDVRYTLSDCLIYSGCEGQVLGAEQTELLPLPDGRYVTADVTCMCLEDHPGRPAKVAAGCGVTFKVEVLARS